MSKGDKYIELTNYLRNISEDKVVLDFNKIEEILCFQLPDSARKYHEWWANTVSHSQAHSWINAGYSTELLSDAITNEKIIFIKKN